MTIIEEDKKVSFINFYLRYSNLKYLVKINNNSLGDSLGDLFYYELLACISQPISRLKHVAP